MARLSAPRGPREKHIVIGWAGLSHKLSDLPESSELSLLVGDPRPGVGVDGDPVAALSVVRLQLPQVGGVTRIGLPANTADL